MSEKRLIIVGTVLVLAAVIAGIWGRPFLEQFSSVPSDVQVTPEPTVTPVSDDMIILEGPRPGETISSPVRVYGKARGPWFFEASFPVVLTDWDGKIIAQAPAQAQGEWMTTDWVPFSVELTFDTPAVSSRASLILQKDNPSGLPEHDDAREITVFIKE